MRYVFTVNGYRTAKRFIAECAAKRKKFWTLALILPMKPNFQLRNVFWMM